MSTQDFDVNLVLNEIHYKYGVNLRESKILNEGIKQAVIKRLEAFLKLIYGTANKRAAHALQQFPWKAFPTRVKELGAWVKKYIIQAEGFKIIWQKMKSGVDIFAQNAELSGRKMNLSFQRFFTKIIAWVFAGNYKEPGVTSGQQELELKKAKRKADRAQLKAIKQEQRKALRKYQMWRDQYTKITKLGQSVSTPIIMQYYLSKHMKMTPQQINQVRIYFIGGKYGGKKMQIKDLQSPSMEDAFLTYRLQGREISRTIAEAVMVKLNVELESLGARPVDNPQQYGNVPDAEVPDAEDVKQAAQNLDSGNTVAEGKYKIAESVSKTIILDGIETKELAGLIRRSLSAAAPEYLLTVH